MEREGLKSGDKRKIEAVVYKERIIDCKDQDEDNKRNLNGMIYWWTRI